MTEIVITPAIAERFEDAEHALSGGGDGHSCQCQWWMMTNADWQKTSQPQRTEMLHAEMAQKLAPALIAYVDGQAAGWVRVGPRTAQIRLARTREFNEHLQHPFDDPSVWAVSCFVVRKEFRGQGLTTRLLTAAVDYARAHGARTIEGYPIDTSAQKKAPNELFRGLLTVFTSAGFEEVARPKVERAIVELTL